WRMPFAGSWTAATRPIPRVSRRRTRSARPLRPGECRSDRAMNANQYVSRLTRRSHSSFFYAFLCLPRRQREAIYAVYAFCRIVDDAVDLGRDREEQRHELQRWREEIARVYGGVPEHPAAQRLQQAIRTFPIPRAALLEIIAGVEMDLERAAYETF